MKNTGKEHNEPSPIEGLSDLADAVKVKEKPRKTFLVRLRNSFLTGIIIAGPLAITAYITIWFVNLFDNWVKPLIPAKYNPDTYLPFDVPGTGLLVALLSITILGALAANLFGRSIITSGEKLLDRMPIVRNVYKALKQIFETALTADGQSFSKVALIEYPRKGIYVIAFVSTETKGEIADVIPGRQKLISVFVPTTPNPTSGFLLFLPEKDVQILDMNVEQGAKLVISAGLVTPEYEKPAKKSGKRTSKNVPTLTKKQADKLPKKKPNPRSKA